MVYIHTSFFICPSVSAKNRPGFLFRKPRRFIMLYSCFLKPSRDYLRGFLIAAWVGAKITGHWTSFFSLRVLLNASF